MRPRHLERAFLAGLAVGVWESLNEIKEKWENDNEFNPQISKSTADEYLTSWHKAVNATRMYK